MLRSARTLAWMAAGTVAGCTAPQEASVIGGSIEVVRGPDSVVTPGRPMPDLVVIRVRDEWGQPRPGAPVTWAVEEGGGAIADTMATTGLDGLATGRWTAGPLPGRQRLAVSVLNEPARRMETTARAFQAERIAVGSRGACGIVAGQAWCTDFGTWFPPDPGAPSSPVPVLRNVRARVVAVSNAFACVLDTDGIPRCSGLHQRPADQAGQPVAGSPPLGALTAEPWSYMCGWALADSTAWCGQPWDGFTQVTPPVKVLELDTEARQACGISIAREAWCWRPGASAVRMTVGPGLPVVSIALRSSAEGAVCAALSDRSVYCWDDDAPVPGRVDGVSATALSCTELCYALPAGPGEVTVFRGSAVLGRFLPPFPVTRIRSGSDGEACIQSAANDTYCLSQAYDPDWWVWVTRFIAMEPIPGPAGPP